MSGSLSGRLLAGVFILLLLFFGITVAALDAVFHRLSDQAMHDRLEGLLAERSMALAQSTERLGGTEARLATIIGSAMDGIISVDEQHERRSACIATSFPITQ